MRKHFALLIITMASLVTTSIAADFDKISKTSKVLILCDRGFSRDTPETIENKLDMLYNDGYGRIFIDSNADNMEDLKKELIDTQKQLEKLLKNPKNTEDYIQQSNQNTLDGIKHRLNLINKIEKEKNRWDIQVFLYDSYIDTIGTLLSNNKRTLVITDINGCCSILNDIILNEEKDLPFIFSKDGCRKIQAAIYNEQPISTKLPNNICRIDKTTPKPEDSKRIRSSSICEVIKTMPELKDFVCTNSNSHNCFSFLTNPTELK